MKISHFKLIVHSIDLLLLLHEAIELLSYDKQKD